MRWREMLKRPRQCCAEMDAIAARRHISPYHLALVHCGLGRIEEALDLLERALRRSKTRKFFGWASIRNWIRLHGHPRFNDLLRKLNHRLGGAADVAGAFALGSGVDRGVAVQDS